MSKLTKKIPDLTPKDRERFFSKIAPKLKNNCANWIGPISRGGYGFFKLKNKNYLAHRVSYFLLSPQNIDNKCVLHRCDNRRCVNIYHLFLGTYADNNRDKMIKNRCSRNHGVKGEKNHKAKLTDAAVKDVRNIWASGKYSQREISKKYQVSQQLISLVVNVKKWKHVRISNETI